MADGETTEGVPLELRSAALHALIRRGDPGAKERARAAYDALSPAEHDAYWAKVDAGADEYHALNAVRRDRLANAARGEDISGSGENAAGKATPLETAAVQAGQAATMGGIPTIAAALGHGEGDDFASRKRSNVADAAEMTAQNPMAASVGEAAGLVLPAVGGAARGIVGGGANAAMQELTLGQLVKEGAKGGAALGAPLGALQTDTGSIPSILGNAAVGAGTGAVTGAVGALVPGLATKIAPSLATTSVSQAARSPMQTASTIADEAVPGLEDLVFQAPAELARAVGNVAPGAGKVAGGLAGMGGGSHIGGPVGAAYGGYKGWQKGGEKGADLGLRLGNWADEWVGGPASSGADIGADVMAGGMGGVDPGEVANQLRFGATPQDIADKTGADLGFVAKIAKQQRTQGGPGGPPHVTPKTSPTDSLSFGSPVPEVTGQVNMPQPSPTASPPPEGLTFDVSGHPEGMGPADFPLQPTPEAAAQQFAAQAAGAPAQGFSLSADDLRAGLRFPGTEDVTQRISNPTGLGPETTPEQWAEMYRAEGHPVPPDLLPDPNAKSVSMRGPKPRPKPPPIKFADPVTEGRVPPMSPTDAAELRDIHLARPADDFVNGERNEMGGYVRQENLPSSQAFNEAMARDDLTRGGRPLTSPPPPAEQMAAAMRGFPPAIQEQALAAIEHQQGAAYAAEVRQALAGPSPFARASIPKGNPAGMHRGR